MEKHFDLTDLEFEKKFESCNLNPEIFTHEAHLRLAWIHITKYRQEIAIQNICRQLITFVDSIGAKNKYNQTLTVAAIKAVYHFIRKLNSNIFPDFINEFPRLKYNFKDLINFHYQENIFKSEEAKKKFFRARPSSL
jgi:hypothetical protein